MFLITRQSNQSHKANDVETKHDIINRIFKNIKIDPIKKYNIINITELATIITTITFHVISSCCEASFWITLGRCRTSCGKISSDAEQQEYKIVVAVMRRSTNDVNVIVCMGIAKKGIIS